MEQDHTEVATIISDFRENGPAALAKYEKGRRTHRDGQRGEQVLNILYSKIAIPLH